MAAWWEDKPHQIAYRLLSRLTRAESKRDSGPVKKALWSAGDIVMLERDRDEDGGEVFVVIGFDGHRAVCALRAQFREGAWYASPRVYRALEPRLGVHGSSSYSVVYALPLLACGIPS